MALRLFVALAGRSAAEAAGHGLAERVHAARRDPAVNRYMLYLSAEQTEGVAYAFWRHGMSRSVLEAHRCSQPAILAGTGLCSASRRSLADPVFAVLRAVVDGLAASTHAGEADARGHLRVRGGALRCRRSKSGDAREDLLRRLGRCPSAGGRVGAGR